MVYRQVENKTLGFLFNLLQSVTKNLISEIGQEKNTLFTCIIIYFLYNIHLRELK